MRSQDDKVEQVSKFLIVVQAKARETGWPVMTFDICSWIKVKPAHLKLGKHAGKHAKVG